MADDLTSIRNFATRFEAETAQSFLQESNIPAMVHADDAAGLRPFMLTGSGGAYVLVRSSDAERAIQLLDECLGPESGEAAATNHP